MNKVERAKLSPHHCVVFPHLGQAHRDGYFDTGIDLPGPGLPPHNALHRMYVSVAAVGELARKEGWLSPAEWAALRDTIGGLREENRVLQEKVDAAEAIVDSIDVIESAAFRARRKTGPRKPTKERVVG